RGNAKIDSSGSVLHKFKRRGQMIFEAAQASEDAITEAALELGADDVRAEGEVIVVLTEPGALYVAREGFVKKGLKPVDAEVLMIPEMTVNVSAKDSETLGKLIAILEEHDDVTNVYANYESEGEQAA
ncbi:MAG TPA: YebC/PmpR family DNA-binding transcriptional regulator, partial [Pseudomonadota bacterium]|nr:YebC/PmpR family DNA-binding transcriptional regulator [Pseudomonadota bacterium]